MHYGGQAYLKAILFFFFFFVYYNSFMYMHLCHHTYPPYIYHLVADISGAVQERGHLGVVLFLPRVLRTLGRYLGTKKRHAILQKPKLGPGQRSRTSSRMMRDSAVVPKKKRGSHAFSRIPTWPGRFRPEPQRPVRKGPPKSSWPPRLALLAPVAGCPSRHSPWGGWPHPAGLWDS